MLGRGLEGVHLGGGDDQGRGSIKLTDINCFDRIFHLIVQILLCFQRKTERYVNNSTYDGALCDTCNEIHQLYRVAALAIL